MKKKILYVMLALMICFLTFPVVNNAKSKKCSHSYKTIYEKSNTYGQHKVIKKCKKCGYINCIRYESHSFTNGTKSYRYIGNFKHKVITSNCKCTKCGVVHGNITKTEKCTRKKGICTKCKNNL